MSNTTIWNALYTSDPAHVKKITGKTYQGDSPKPHWMIKRLTEQFGPVGRGFGWEVISSEYINSIPRPDGIEKRHECRILFWWSDDSGRHKVESFGGTKALYKAKGDEGYWVDDEDAAKKSLTDAITKAASWLGLAGDIFMGQWNDSKYQTELREVAKAKKPATENGAVARDDVAGQEPPHDPNTGEVTEGIKDEHGGGGLLQAWVDGIRDKLPATANPRQIADACAAQLITDLDKYKTEMWLDRYLNGRAKIIDTFRDRYSDLYAAVTDAIGARRAAIRGEDGDAADYQPMGLREQLERSVEMGEAQ